MDSTKIRRLITQSMAFVIALLSYNLQIEAQPTSLMRAIENQHPLAKINELIKNGADVNAVDNEFLRCYKPVLRYALDRVIRNPDSFSVEIIKVLIKSGANISAQTYNRTTDIRFYGMMPLLTYAAIYTSAEIVQILIDAGARDLDTCHAADASSLEFKKTALEVAQELGRTETIQILTCIKPI
jgi:ankyrin repeat protein